MANFGSYRKILGYKPIIYKGISKLFFSVVNKRKRYLTLLVLPILLVILYYVFPAAKVETYKPQPNAKLQNKKDLLGGYQGFVVNSLGNKEHKIMHINEHYHEDSITLKLISSSNIDVLTAKYNFENMLIINQSLDSAYIELKDSIPIIKLNNEFDEIWEFTKIR